MTTLYLNYTPDKEPLFRKVEYADDRAVDTARKAMTGKSRIIKVVEYDSLKPDSGKMSVLPVYSSADSETVGDGSESVSAPVSAPVTNAELKEQNRSNPDNPFTPVSSSASASGSDSGSSSASGSTPDSSSGSGSSSSSASSGGGTKSKRKTPLGKKMKKTRKSSSVKGNDE
jgi:hypothetical protein